MNPERQFLPMKLTGRLQEPPSALLSEMVLQPQFTYELQHLLPHYIQIEKVMASEYERLGVMPTQEAQEVVHLLDQIDREALVADPDTNMSDILFAIERYVEMRLTQKTIAWHVDRSRNDVQATAQVMFAREKLLDVIKALITFSDAIRALAEETVELPMPGYTHYQPAQILTAGFYLAAVSEQLGKTIHRLQTLFDEINECPLGSGAMAGLELLWDRQALAEKLGFTRPVRHALVGVASKEWLLHIAAELSTASVMLSRFVTDLITWGSSEYCFIDLPDQLSGISSAMPQKKNFPILERIRGKTAHISAYYLDFVIAQRNTPFTNLVETAKEGGSNFSVLMHDMRTLVELFTIVIQNVLFQKERMYSICVKEFFGGFTLSNLLSLQAGIPFREAQVLAGRYIVKMIAQGRLPHEVSVLTLNDICREGGYSFTITESELRQVFSVEHNLHNKHSSGSTHPVEVSALLGLHKQERDRQQARWEQQARNLAATDKI